MIPTITKKNYQNVVISTGNIINNELGRKSNEELYDGLKITLHSEPDVERVVVDMYGRVQRATQELNNKLTENRRNEISIGAKIFVNKKATSCVQEAIETLLNILDVTYVDNVVLAYHPNPVASATVAATTSGIPKTPCVEGNASGTAVSNSDNNWSTRNGVTGLAELKELYKILELNAAQQKINQLGIADLDATALQQLHTSASVPPTIAQVNLSTCCVVPPELQEFCTAKDIQLNTHSDPELLLPAEQFAGLAPGYSIDWALRYQVHLRCRGVLIAKGYIVGASKPRAD